MLLRRRYPQAQSPEKQKAGKKKKKRQFGRVDIPQEAFINAGDGRMTGKRSEIVAAVPSSTVPVPWRSFGLQQRLASSRRGA